MVFKNELFFLSTFHVRQFSFSINDQVCDFITVEAAFQAQKVPEIANRFSQIRGLEARRLGERLRILVDNWDEYQFYAMANAIHAKFHYPDLMIQLQNIDGAIVMDNYWKDRFWGVYKGEGHNFLGQMYEDMREHNNSLDSLYSLIQSKLIPEYKKLV